MAVATNEHFPASPITEPPVQVVVAVARACWQEFIVHTDGDGLFIPILEKFPYSGVDEG